MDTGNCERRGGHGFLDFTVRSRGTGQATGERLGRTLIPWHYFSRVRYFSSVGLVCRLSFSGRVKA